jgi:hypothetical protein
MDSGFEVDESTVHVLAETLSKVKGLSRSIDGSLTKLSKSSSVAEAAIKPIYGTTLELNIKGRSACNVDVLARIFTNYRFEREPSSH